MAPTKWNGSLAIYNNIIQPFFLKYGEKIDTVINRVTNIKNWRGKLYRFLHERSVVTDLQAKIEEKTGIDRFYIIFAGEVFFVVYFIIGYGSTLICNCIVCVYPAYSSIKAIEIRNKEDELCTIWLIYWIVFSTFFMFEQFADPILNWIPFYSFLKFLFLLYCMTRIGSSMIYNNIVQPLFLKHAENIDKVMSHVTNIASEAHNLASDVIDDTGQAASKAMLEETSVSIVKRVTADSPAYISNKPTSSISSSQLEQFYLALAVLAVLAVLVLKLLDDLELDEILDLD